MAAAAGSEDLPDMHEPIRVRVASDGDAQAMLQVAHTAFAARRPVDPPAAALTDTVDDYHRALAEGWGVCALDGDRLVGCLLIAHDGAVARLRRVAVLPEAAGRGVAKLLVGGAVSLAADAGLERVELACRREFPELAAWWQAHGFDTSLRTLLIFKDLTKVSPFRIIGRNQEITLVFLNGESNFHNSILV